MESQAILQYSLMKQGAFEDYPFGPEVIVIKIAAKMFALFSRRDGQVHLSLKCDPNYAEILRQQYASVTPGYHLNKRHWNTLLLDGTIPEEEVREMVDHSYDLVYKSLTREQRDSIAAVR